MDERKQKAGGASAGAITGGHSSNDSTDRIDRDEIIRAARLLIAPGGITELRALNATLNGSRYIGTVSGYFDSAAKLADAAANITSAKGICLVLNELNRALLARASNRVRTVGKSDPLTADHDITRRRWLLIDADVQRPAGISATDEERAAAYQRAEAIVRFLLIENGWPDPIVADSGNGYHLLYRIDLPADDGGVVQRCLESLAARFDDDRAKVDTTVHNPARICKLYGTLACKGDSTPDRPHRMARLLEVPAKVELVTETMLLALGGPGEPQSNQSTKPAPSAGAFELAAWIAQHLPEATGPEPWKGGGQIWELPTCPYNADHKGSAYIGRQPSGEILAGCHHNSCSWKWHELRARFDPPQTRRRESRQQAGGEAEPIIVRLADVKPEPLRWLWRGRIPSGKLSLICGDPNGGKTLLTLDMAARLSRGTSWPDRRDEPNPAGDVLLLSAEDDPADTIVPRLMAAGADLNRIRMMQGVKRNGSGKASFFSLAIDVGALERVADSMPSLKLIVIDPVSSYMGGDTDSHNNTDVRGVLAPLAELAARRNIAVVVVTHMNKGAGGRAMYRAIGSIAFIAAARAAWAVVRDPHDETRRRRGLLPIKLNIAAETSGIAYTIEPATVNGIDTAAVHWEAGPLEARADEWLAAEQSIGDDEGRGARQDAAEWLRQLLAEGPLAADEVLRQAKQYGIAKRTLDRAKIDAGVKPKHKGFGPGAKWYWALAADHRLPSVPIECHPTDVATYGEVGNLCSEQGDAA